VIVASKHSQIVPLSGRCCTTGTDPSPAYALPQLQDARFVATDTTAGKKR